MPHIRADVTSQSHAIVKAARESAMQITGVTGCRDVSVHRAEDGLHLTVTCVVDSNLAVSEAHEVSTRVEEILRMKIDGVSRVLVHLEPNRLSRR
jgi:divalent metal cation (Fe/Co/Zn/Cd) transporter